MSQIYWRPKFQRKSGPLATVFFRKKAFVGRNLLEKLSKFDQNIFLFELVKLLRKGPDKGSNWHFLIFAKQNNFLSVYCLLFDLLRPFYNFIDPFFLVSPKHFVSPVFWLILPCSKNQLFFLSSNSESLNK